MTNPVLIEVTRGERAESWHRGAVAIADAAADIVFSAGDIAAPVYPRSAVKAIQALPLVECGAAEAFGFGDRELALAQSSHGGEPHHVEGARAMLAAIGVDEAVLECGIHDPHHRPTAAKMRARGEKPGPIHNNCSGKHAGFLAVARHLGHDPAGYVEPGHPVQVLVREALAGVTGAALGAAEGGVDGCSIPTYPIALRQLAVGFARFSAADGFGPGRNAAARRIMSAALAKPEYTAATGQFAPFAMAALPGRALVKSGAEGVYVAAVPAARLGVAVKCDDGGRRGGEAMMACVLARLFPEAAATLCARAAGPVHTVRGAIVGEIRAVGLSAIRPQ